MNDKSGNINQAQSELLGRMGQQLALVVGATARDFVAACELPNDERHFNATLLTLLETIVFVSVCSGYKTQRDRRLALDDMHKGMKRLLLDYHRDLDKENLQ